MEIPERTFRSELKNTYTWSTKTTGKSETDLNPSDTFNIGRRNQQNKHGLIEKDQILEYQIPEQT